MPLFLSQTAPLSIEAGSTELVLETDSDCVYYLESGTDLNDFTYAGEIIKGDGTIHRKTFTITEPRQFFRYQEIQNADLDTIDTDQDGLSDAFELNTFSASTNTGSSPLSNDSNGNTIPDSLEDLDNDGLTAEEEQELGTNPLLPDTDEDSVLDGEDGWALCDKLAPERLLKQNYAVIALKEIPSNTSPVHIQINKNFRALIRLGDEYFYSNSQGINELDNGNSRIHYQDLNDFNYFTKIDYRDGNASIILDGQHFTDLEYVDLFSPNTPLATPTFSSILTDSEGNSLGEVNQIDDRSSGPTYLEHNVGVKWTPSGVYSLIDSSHPVIGHNIQYCGTMKASSHGLNPTVDQYMVNEPIKNGIYTTPLEINTSNLVVATDKKWQDYFYVKDCQAEDDTDFLSGGMVSQNFGILKNNALQHLLQNTSLVKASLSNQNTVQFEGYENGNYCYKIWLDLKAGLRNDQEVDDTPSFTKIDWDSDWGEKPPVNLNARMQGWRNSDDNIPQLWQNCKWHDIEIEGYQDIKIFDINDHGALGAQVTKKASTDSNGNTIPESTHAVILLPVDLKVDADRDGEITSSDVTTESEPYRFWINNDTDDTDIIDGDKGEDPASTADNSNNIIDTERDLEDFTRVWIKIGGMHDQLKAGKMQLGFKWTDTSGSPCVKLYWASDPDGETYYLQDTGIPVVQTTTDRANSLGTISGGTATFIDPKVFAYIENDDGWVHFLFEGVTKGEGKLTSVIKYNNTESDASSVDVKLMDVREMYERVKTTPDGVDQFTEPLSYKATDAGNQYGIPPEPTISWAPVETEHDFTPDPEEEKQYLVFVHGFNMLNPAVLTWGDTMYKRLWHQGYKGRFATVKWPTYSVTITLPGQDPPLFYNPSDYRAWVSGKGLAQYINQLPEEYEKKLCAHSMGNIVSGGAFRAGMTVGAYALFNAAVPAMCYDGDDSLYDPMFATYKTPDGATGDTITLGLGFKEKLSISNVSDANPINYYLPEDNALGPWATINNVIKANNGWSSYYSCDLSEPNGEKVYHFDGLPRRYIRSYNESAAYATQSRTLAVGADGDTNGSINSSDAINLEKFGFGEEHSAQWNWNIQKTFSFFENLAEQLELTP